LKIAKMDFKLDAHESLMQVSEPWDFDTQDSKIHARHLADAMIEFMTAQKGIGLAANQIGITKRVFIIGSYNIEGFPIPFAVFNPKIISTSNTQELVEEGCLSYPNLWLKVTRPCSIVAEYQDSDSNTHTVEMSGLIARCFQHELDHLNGVCFVDKVSPMRLQLAMKKLRKRK
jgi:peptide deformylase